MSAPRFPRGRLLPEDEGELSIAIGVLPDRRTLVLEFGKPVKWIGLGARDVDALIERFKAARATMVEAGDVSY